LNWMWLPRCATFSQPSAWSSRMRSLLETDGIPDDTHPVCIRQQGPRAHPKAIAGASVAVKANKA